MDKKAWIVTSLCALGMLWYLFDYAPKAERARRAIQQQKMIEEKAKQAAAEAASGAAAETGQGETAEAGGTPDATPAEGSSATPPVAKESFVLKTNDETGKPAVEFNFTNQAAGIETAVLLQHLSAFNKEKPEEEFVPIKLNAYSDYPIGALSHGVGEIEQLVYQVVSKSDDEIVFEATTPELIKVTKKYSLLDPAEPGAAYRVNLELTLENTDTRRNPMGEYYVYAGAMGALKPDEFMQGDNYTGFLYKEGKKTQDRKVTHFKKESNRNYNPTTEELFWAGPTSQYFVQNLCPPEPYTAKIWAQRFPITQIEGFSVEQSKGLYAVQGAIGLPDQALGAGESITQSFELYLGPKTLKELKAMGKDREKIMSYDIVPVIGGLAAPVSKFLMAMLLWLQGMVHNYGVAILIMTVLLRTAMWPVYAKSQKTMKRMSKLSPKMTALREKYKDNPQKMQQETAKLFKENGMGPLGPLGGCLPMLIQIPVFLGFFQMLRMAVELRHEPFVAWVNDLSMPDTVFTIPFIELPINILPILMAVTMIWQMRITPSTGDPMQKKLMMIMPVVFLVFCYNFASALALYWTGQNLFSIGQTYLSRNKELDEPEKEPELTPQEIAKKRAAQGGVRTGGARAKKKKKS